MVDRRLYVSIIVNIFQSYIIMVRSLNILNIVLSELAKFLIKKINIDNGYQIFV